MRLIGAPCNVGVQRYLPVLKSRHRLGELFRYQNLGLLVATLEGRG